MNKFLFIVIVLIISVAFFSSFFQIDAVDLFLWRCAPTQDQQSRVFRKIPPTFSVGFHINLDTT